MNGDYEKRSYEKEGKGNKAPDFEVDSNIIVEKAARTPQ